MQNPNSLDDNAIASISIHLKDPEALLELHVVMRRARDFILTLYQDKEWVHLATYHILKSRIVLVQAESLEGEPIRSW